MRFAAFVLVAACSVGCRKKEQPTDGAALSQIFADTVDAAAADPSASVATDEPLPSLKPVIAPPPVIGAPKPTPSVAASQPSPGAGNPNLPQCVVARAFCEKNNPQCEAKKQACVAAGGRM